MRCLLPTGNKQELPQLVAAQRKHWLSCLWHATHLQPDSISVWPPQSPEQGLAQLASAQAEKAAERAREEGQRVKEAKAEAKAQRAEVDLGMTEAAKKARDAARQARKIASEAKAKAQVGMPWATCWVSCTPGLLHVLCLCVQVQVQAMGTRPTASLALKHPSPAPMTPLDRTWRAIVLMLRAGQNC